MEDKKTLRQKVAIKLINQYLEEVITVLFSEYIPIKKDSHEHL